MPDVLVIGASGVLGAKLVAEATARDGWQVTAGSRDPRAASAASSTVTVDVRSADSVRRAVAGHDLVLVAAPQEGALVQQVCRAGDVPCVDVTTSARTVEEVARLGPGATSVVMAGLFPGLSGLLVRQVQEAGVSAVDVLLLQSANADVGGAGVAQMLRLLAASPHVTGTVDGVKALSMRHPESQVLARPSAAYWTAWDDRRLTAVVAGLRRARLLGRVARPQVAAVVRHDPNRHERVRVVVEGRGGGPAAAAGVAVEASSDYGATAHVAGVLGQLALERPDGGAGHPMMFTSAAEVLDRCRPDIVRPVPRGSH